MKHTMPSILASVLAALGWMLPRMAHAASENGIADTGPMPKIGLILLAVVVVILLILILKHIAIIALLIVLLGVAGWTLLRQGRKQGLDLPQLPRIEMRLNERARSALSDSAALEAWHAARRNVSGLRDPAQSSMPQARAAFRELLDELARQADELALQGKEFAAEELHRFRESVQMEEWPPN